MIEVGTFAPEFTLATTRGKTLRLTDFRGQQRVLLLFYPRNLAGG